MKTKLNCAFLLVIALFLTNLIKGQNYVDTLYQYSISTLDYGKDTTFAGFEKTLNLDLAVPTNDTLSSCGRPLMLIVHGGAFYAGTKNDGNPQNLLKHFAKRGYVTASINYRLGMFLSDQSRNCNIPEWNCLQIADSAEWYRSYYRGIQDANGALRFLINNASTFGIDPNNVFVVGESAGAFIALGVGFLDSNEVRWTNVNDLGQILPPHTDYETPCIVPNQQATNVAAMDLHRKAMGLPKGTLNTTTIPYQIKGVASFYGAVFDDLFDNPNNLPQPALYLFHQPNDLLVPYNRDKILQGTSSCAADNFGCANIQNRPYCNGSNKINSIIATHQTNGQVVPDVLFEKTTDQTPCLFQANNPYTGHSIDNYWLRTKNLANFFAPKISICNTSGISTNTTSESIKIFPNPVQKNAAFSIWTGEETPKSIAIFDLSGRQFANLTIQRSNGLTEVQLTKELIPGIYFVQVNLNQKSQTLKLVIE